MRRGSERSGKLRRVAAVLNLEEGDSCLRSGILKLGRAW